MRLRLSTVALLLLAPLVLLAGCRCCPGSADEAGLPARVRLHETPQAR